jgi:ribosomal protein L31E
MINESISKAEKSDGVKLEELLNRLIQKVGRETKKFKFRAHAATKKGTNEMERSILHRKENLSISDDINL